MEDNTSVREPLQARSQATFERFIEATASLLEEQAFDQVTVADIVAKANRTVGSFYARFDDKHAVLLVLSDRFDQHDTEVTRAFCDPVRWEGASLGDFVHERVQLKVWTYRSATPLLRTVLGAASVDDRFRSRRQQALRFSADSFKRVVFTRSAELGCADPGRASDRAFELLAASLDHHLLLGHFTETSPTGDQALIDDLAEQCLTILGARSLERTKGSRLPVG